MEAIKKETPAIILCVLAVATAAIWYAVFYAGWHQRLVIRFFDVGQGDAVFIEAPGGNQMLIDGGPSDRILSKLGGAMPFWDRSIDAVVLTHPHADHVAGLVDVLKQYRVGVVVESGAAYATPEYDEWHRLLREKNIPVVIARRGQIVHAGGGVEMDILAPFGSFDGASPKNVHDAMVVAKLTYASTTVMLTGDAEKSMEYQLMVSGDDLRSDILKGGHHGSKTSSTEAFVKAVSPDVAVLSVGRKNRYGHPHPDVIARFKTLGIPVHRTDEEGDIVLRSDGISYALIPQ